jgi:hypothetical protein
MPYFLRFAGTGVDFNNPLTPSKTRKKYVIIALFAIRPGGEIGRRRGLKKLVNSSTTNKHAGYN